MKVARFEQLVHIKARQAMANRNDVVVTSLSRADGVPLFQEQGTKIIMVSSNLTGGQAEGLRKAIGGRRAEAVLKGRSATEVCTSAVRKTSRKPLSEACLPYCVPCSERLQWSFRCNEGEGAKNPPADHEP